MRIINVILGGVQRQLTKRPPAKRKPCVLLLQEAPAGVMQDQLVQQSLAHVVAQPALLSDGIAQAIGCGM